MTRRSCAPDERDRLAQAIFEVRPGPPPEHVVRQRDIQRAPAKIAGPGRPVSGLAGEARDLREHLVEAVHGGLDRGTDIEEMSVSLFRRECESVGDIIDEHVVPRLMAVAEDRRCLSIQHAGGEDRDHPCLAVRVLTGPVNVGERERRPPDAVVAFIEAEVVDDDLLAHPIRRDRTSSTESRLPHRELAWFPVQGSPRRRIHHLADTRPPCTFEHVDRSHHVDGCIEHGVVHRGRDRGLGSEVHHDIRPQPFEQGQEALSSNVHVEERELVAVPACLADVGDPTGRQVVDRDDPMSLGQQAIAQVRTDEPGSSRDQERGHPSSSEGSAPTPRDVRSPRSNLHAPATAIIAPLSVQRSSEGNSTRSPASAPAFSIRSRNRVLATTPPPSSTVSTRRSRAASIVLATWTSTMASWNDAARSAGSTSRPAWRSALTCRSTAVFRPDSEKSKSPESAIARGNRIAFGSPSRASRSSAGPPGKPSPRNRAILSNASPAASSTVCPRSSYRWGSGMCTSIVWPPETTRHTAGVRSGPWSTAFASMCPSRWFTPISGAPVASAIDLAAAIPTRSAPTRPGPTVTATPSRSPNPHPAVSSAASISGVSASTCARLASSGTTPPKRSCTSTWLAMRLASTVSRSTTATAVSSHDVSIPNTFTARPSRSGLRVVGEERSRDLGAKAVGELVEQPTQARPELGVADPVQPHDQRVLADLLIVVLPDADGAEPEPGVQPLGTPVGDADLERHGLGAHVVGRQDQIVQQARADLLALAFGIDGDVGHVGLFPVADEPSVADDLPIDACNEVAPVPRLGHLREEQVGAPRARVDLAFDRHDATEVAPAHPGHLKPRRLWLADPK